ncbi:hypothetical protein ACVWZV_007630 [Bradyrhizobium sp. GM5.1]
MPRDDVAHVPRQEAVTLFLTQQERNAGARERFRSEGQTCGIERRRGDAERYQHAAFRSAGIANRQPAELADEDQDAGAGQRQQRGKGRDAARGRQRSFEGNDNQPDCGE